MRSQYHATSEQLRESVTHAPLPSTSLAWPHCTTYGTLHWCTTTVSTKPQQVSVVHRIFSSVFNGYTPGAHLPIKDL